MSGIFGFLETPNRTGNNTINIEHMNLWNRAYGTDNEEVVSSAFFCFGCCCEKLSENTKPSTPVLKRNDTYAVIDALLYNREELIAKCNVPENISNEELLFTYIEYFGPNALKEVNGDFSGAIYDDTEKILLLFRDHLGVRPLFYYADNNFVAFSTDIRGLTSLSQVDATVNEDWVFKTISGYTTIGTENTEFEHIFCVTPAGYITFSYENNKLNISKNSYWQLGSKKIRLSSENAYRDTLRELITDSIKRRLDAISGLIGAELSGGLDSGVIDILINRLDRDCIYYSWSVDPAELPMAEDDERLVIADICKQENITCYFSKQVMDFGNKSLIGENMKKIGITLEAGESAAFGYALPPYLNALTICGTSEFISRSGARVVFTGHGGDEGVSHRCNPYELFYHHEYFYYLKYIWSTTYGKKHRILKSLKNCYRNLTETRKKFMQPFRNPFVAPELLNTEFASKFQEKDMPVLHFAYNPKAYVQEGGSRNRLDNVSLLGAYNGVRYLIPYLDYRVIDFAVSIPRHLYLKGHKNRYIFRETFKDIMPDSLYTLRHKEDNSRKNMVGNPNWFEEFQKNKAYVVSKLDRSYWERYLDFNVIDEWLNRGKPSDEERFHDESILRCLYSCALVENLVKKSREL